MKRSVTITYLEMLERGQLRGKACPEPQLTIAECVLRQPELNQFLYQWVGRGWYWKDRLSWSDDQWAAYTADTNVRTWIAYLQGSIAGYFELIRHDDEGIEIGYFGLLPECIGKGYGGYLLSETIRRAWDWGTQRVWVHTCTLDHEGALSNYQARGMKIYKTETIEDQYNGDEGSV